MLTKYIDPVITILTTSFGFILLGWLWLDIRRLKKKKKADSLMILAVFFCWNIWCISEKQQPRPAYTDSLPELVKHVEVSYYHLWHLTRGEQTYFQVIGPYSVAAIIKIVVTVSSGPPGYIFNQQGVLVDWVRDVDEAPRSWHQWDIMSQRRERISFDRAFVFIEETEKASVEQSAQSERTSPQEKKTQK